MDIEAAIYKANDKMTFLANDKEAFRLYNMREMAQIDFNSGMRKARSDGIMEVARNLLEMDITIDQIVKATGLTHDEVGKLKF